MKNYVKIIAKEWNAIVSKHHKKTGEHAPLEMNTKPSLIHPDGAVRMFKLMQEELWEFKESYELENISDKERLVSVFDSLLDMQYVLDGIFAQHGLENHKEDGLDEVHRSNKTKFVNGEFKTNDIGKVLKPDTYEKPNLLKVLFG